MSWTTRAGTTVPSTSAAGDHSTRDVQEPVGQPDPHAVDVMQVDFSARTGAFRGGASGALYGLGARGTPTRALLDGPAITNASQKAPHGSQHPNGEALQVETDFFAAGGRELYVYVQDYYPDWPYHGGQRPQGQPAWDFLGVVDLVVEAVARGSARPQDYVFIPFNEPDGGNWYPDWDQHGQQFLQDWRDVHQRIQAIWARHGLGRARIGGPGDTRWQPERSAAFLEFAARHEVLPDVFIWHELGIENLATYRSHYAAYRQLETNLGITALPVNITEYGMLRDMGVPGQLIQWLAMFEDTKVDAQLAYWNLAGNLSDNCARHNSANGGWWLLRWYADLHASQTVSVRPPHPETTDTLQAIAAIDDVQRRATVVLGGSTATIELQLRGLEEAVFGSHVDVEVRQVLATGAHGICDAPRVVHALRAAPLGAGCLNLCLTPYDRTAAYQVMILPTRASDVSEAQQQQPWVALAEAEDLRLTDTRATHHDPQRDDGWSFLASRGADVAGLPLVSSRIDWPVQVPRDGAYRLQVIGATLGAPGQHALFVEEEFSALVSYGADLALSRAQRHQYRGSAEVDVFLRAGQRTLSLRGSRDGVDVLPGADTTVDRLSLTDLGDGEPHHTPAASLRLLDGAQLIWDDPGQAGWAQLQVGQRARGVLTTMASGSYLLTVHWSSGTNCHLRVVLDHEEEHAVLAPVAGQRTSVLPLQLALGVSTIELTCSAVAAIKGFTLRRDTSTDDAGTGVHGIAAAELTLHGSAYLHELPASANVQGAAVRGIGGVFGGSVVVPRDGWRARAGHHHLRLRYANAELVGEHDYNPQVIERVLQVREGGQLIGTAVAPYTGSWDSFDELTMRVNLSTHDQPLHLGCDGRRSPSIAEVTLVPAPGRSCR